MGGEHFVNELPVRKHPRLKGYNYNNNGVYFITFCVAGRHEMLGKIVGRGDPDAPCIQLSEHGIIVQKHIDQIELHYNGVIVDKYVVMPNHIHMIIVVNRDGGMEHREGGASGSPRPTNALIPNIIKALKRLTNKVYGFNMWQTSFHDRIIRDEADYRTICQYIDENPARWAEDEYHG